MSDYFGKDVFKLGFGLMRLPKDAEGKIDVEHTSRMVDAFMEAGGTYFDTAFVYDGGESEKAAGKALIQRHPRESFTLATKMNAGMRGATAETVKQQFDISLERTGAGYFDYYLLHALGRGNISNYDNFGIWDFVKEKKAQGLVKHYGFSFHSDPDHLEELLTKHPDVDFIQLQINYADWLNPGVASKECYEIARRHGVSITVMEPVKGGALANPIPGVQQILKEADPNASFASWAIRYVASMDGIITVLSGMSNMQQMEDNLSYMRNFKPLSAEEQEVIKRVQKELTKDHSIKCTACHYCTEGCPMNIPIPEIFGVKNRADIDPGWDHGKGAYRVATHGKGIASQCVGCGQCEHVCPQHLPIIELLKTCTELE